MMDQFWLTICVIMIPGILWASWIDYRQRRVPNWLNGALALAGLLAQFHFHGLSGVGQGLMGMLVGFGVLIVPWLMRGMGAGDVKLMMAIGVWLGPWLTLLAFCAGAIVGGLMAVGMILGSGRFWQACGNVRTILTKVTSRSTVFSDFGSARSFGSSSQLLPYGVPLTIGTLIVFFGQELIAG